MEIQQPGNLNCPLEVSYTMKPLFITSLLLGLMVVAAASCQTKDTERQVLENLEEKYKELDQNAEFVSVNGIPVAQEIRFIQPDDAVVPDYRNLRQIALIRHGEPDLHKTGKFSYDQAKEYIKHYDSVGIILPDRPFFMLKEDEAVKLYTSTIPRAQATARYLFGENREAIISAGFREFDRQLGNRRFKMNLPLRYWTVSARIMWMLGLEREGIESFSEARERAQKAADLLAQATDEETKAVLVAHGFLNRYIKKNLEKSGWHVVREGGSNYFSTTILAKYEEDREPNSLVSELNR